MTSILCIAAACLLNTEGQVLLVRKKGTSSFMQPGGKLEPDESPLEAIVREVNEELGITLAPEDLTPNGLWLGPAANEADTFIKAYLFDGLCTATPQALAELDEIMWISPTEALLRDDIAPLLRDKVLPDALDRRSRPMAKSANSRVSKQHPRLSS